jgi:membrane-bound inhibitor of C-type lysozyme
MTIRHVPLAALAMLFIAASSASAKEANYACSGGTQLSAVFSRSTGPLGQVVLTIDESPDGIVLQQVQSADGGRYANNDMEFWIKGNSATFSRLGNSETCHIVR